MRARKRFAQHFLEAAWVDKLVEAVNASPDDVILEIGPGAGALTRPLAATGVPILAVEVDRDLVAALAAESPPNVTIISGDILEVDVVPYLYGLGSQGSPGEAGRLRPPRR
ncbi:MAG TPA: rRNA adenine N-6-methyltransferase family protein, partial [Vicinamibacterales bacterium]|nr:rRNA adenine N-6-methyltransferase family protein [Vicinamibacterales bacterium]